MLALFGRYEDPPFTIDLLPPFLPPLADVALAFYGRYEDQPFTIGFPDVDGGSPVRSRGTKLKCQCPNDLVPAFREVRTGDVLITVPSVTLIAHLAAHPRP